MQRLIELLMQFRILLLYTFISILYTFISTFLLALPTMLLWNWLIPNLFFWKIAQIGFLEAWGISFLCAILFKLSN